MKSKQLAKGMDQAHGRGCSPIVHEPVQQSQDYWNRRCAPVRGYRVPFAARVQRRLWLGKYQSLQRLCWIEALDPKELEDFRLHKAQYMAKDKWGRDVFLAESQYMLQMAQVNYKKLVFHFTSEF